MLSLRILALGLLLSAAPARAQATATGTIEGRVFNPANGEYLEKARVTIDGTGLETFTDSSGQYRLTSVPAGAARVRIFYTGLDVQTDTVAVAAGTTVQRDFNLAVGPGKPGEVVQLDQFVVATTKQMDGAAIAINEQRFASSIKSVVSADEFGTVVEGNVGDFLKFLPGITIDTGGGDARTISMNGVPSNYVPVTIGGFALASAQSSGTGRTVELEQVSVNNIARFEVLHSPTPESPGAALAGSVNMVPRSAFERARPVFSGSVFLMMKDNYKDFRKTPGPRATPTRKIKPGFDFSYIVPVNKRFGFTVSAANSTQYTSEDFSQNVWRGGGATTTGLTTVTANSTPQQFPDTTPDKPYLSDYAVQDANKFSKRTSFGLTVDYKIARNDRLSFSFQWALFDAELSNRKLTFFVNRVAPGDFTLTSTRGEIGRGEIRLDNGGMRQKSGTTYMPTLTYRHDGPVWKFESGLGHSHASNHYKDGYRGFFNNSTARRTGVTVNFDDMFYLRPRVISVFDGTTGAPLDPYNLANYSLTSASLGEQESGDLQRSAFANLRRDFVVRDIPIALKGGLDVHQSVRDIRKYSPSWNFVGADGRTSTTPVGNDDSAAVVFDQSFSQRIAPFGFPRIQWVSQEQLWDLYQKRPEYFSLGTNNAYRSLIDQSKYAEEIISAAYLRTDLAFLDRRLKFVGGLRAEQTNITAEGPLTDPTRNFQRDAKGGILRDAGGKPLLIVPTSDALGVSKLTYIDRGLHAQKEYLRLFPNLNASYNVRENLIARAAWYSSVGRPDFNQYSGGLTLPDTDAVPSPGNRISVNNIGIKAWSARTTKVRLEYYFDRVGQVSIGAFRRDFKNFFGNIVTPATPEFLSLYNLDPAVYSAFDVSTNYNLASTVRMTGLEFDYKQALTFLPQWARGVQVFANASAQRATGVAADNFSGFIPRSGSWGVSLSRQTFNLKANWNYRGRQRRGILTGRGLEAGTYEWGSKRLYLDISGDYALTKHLALFASLRNVNDATEDFKRFGPSTPALANFRQRQDYASAWIFGVKGTF